MPENQNSTDNSGIVSPVNTPNTTPPAESTIDFSKFSLGAEPTPPPTTETPPLEEKNTVSQETNIPPTQETQSIIASINATSSEEKKEDANVEQIQIQEEKIAGEKRVQLGTSGMQEARKVSRADRYLQRLVLGYVCIGIGILVSARCWIYSTYMDASLNNDPSQQTLIDTYKNIEKTISEYTNINDYALLSKETSFTKYNIENIISNPNTNYLQKKDILQNLVTIFIGTIQNESQKLLTFKQEVEKYGYIPTDIYDIVNQENSLQNIKKKLELTETIRFLIAFKAFEYLDSAIQGFIDTVQMSADTAKENIKKINERGEDDIINYTKNCYLNPYENSSSCSITNDFDNYYTIIDSKNTIDTTFFKKFAEYTDKKLRDTTVPMLTINFASSDPKDNNLSMTIELNTNTNDEIALIKENILNPHLFILTSILHMLKESLLIIGEGIKTDEIQIQPKTVRIGSSMFTTNSSTTNLILPIQKTSQREITDFFNQK